MRRSGFLYQSRPGNLVVEPPRETPARICCEFQRIQDVVNSVCSCSRRSRENTDVSALLEAISYMLLGFGRRLEPRFDCGSHPRRIGRSSVYEIASSLVEGEPKSRLEMPRTCALNYTLYIADIFNTGGPQPFLECGCPIFCVDGDAIFPDSTAAKDSAKPCS